MTQQLMRSNTDKMVAGVCGGLAYYFGVDPVITRLAMLGLIFAGGIGLILYVVLWLVMPEGHASAVPSQSDGLRYDPQTGQPLAMPAQPERRQRVLGIVLVGIGLLMLSSMVPYGSEIVLAIAFVIGGVYILRRTQ